MEFEIEFYSTDPNGDDKPLASFLLDLRRRQPYLEKLLVAGLTKLRNPLHHHPPLARAVDSTNGIFELRVGGTNIARIFFFFEPGRRIVATNGYVKKSQRLDRSELERAQRYKAEWERRHHA